MKFVIASLWMVVWLAVLGAEPTARAQTARTSVTLINGITVSGTVARVTGTGIEVETPAGMRTYPWYALAPGTRYRYDMNYRMNLVGYLAGQNQGGLTNTPDPQYDPLRPDSGPDADASGDAGAPRITSLFAPAGGIKPSTFRNLQEMITTNTWFAAIQYGAQSNEVALFGMVSGPSLNHIGLNVASGRTSRGSPARKKIGNEEYAAFPIQRFSATAGSYLWESALHWLVMTNRIPGWALSADVTAVKNGLTNSFVLTGEPAGLRRGDGILYPRPLIDVPTFEFRVLFEGDAPLLLARLRIARLTLLPSAGMDNTVTLEIKDAKGLSLIKKTIPHVRDIPPGGYSLRLPVSPLRPGQTYTVLASARLGEVFGTVRGEETIIMPAAGR